MASKKQFFCIRHIFFRHLFSLIYILHRLTLSYFQIWRHQPLYLIKRMMLELYISSVLLATHLYLLEWFSRLGVSRNCQVVLPLERTVSVACRGIISHNPLLRSVSIWTSGGGIPLAKQHTETFSLELISSEGVVINVTVAGTCNPLRAVLPTVWRFGGLSVYGLWVDKISSHQFSFPIEAFLKYFSFTNHKIKNITPQIQYLYTVYI